MEPEREFDLSMEVQSSYLYAELRSNTISNHIVTTYLKSLSEACAELGLFRILLVRDIPKVLSLPNAFHEVETIVRLFSRIQVAVVNPHPENQEGLEFDVIVINNRGGNFALFKTVADASKWLLDVAAGILFCFAVSASLCQ